MTLSSGASCQVKAQYLLGQITLPVQFGTPDHFRIEFINFMVADFDGT